MANPEHVKILKQGVEQWNKWRGEHLDVAPDLIGAELGDADLIEAYLGEANLSGANLRDADLSHADLGAADLSRTDLSRAKLGWAGLTGANLSTANLSRANLSGANLGWADLRGANLGGANFSEARARATIFADVDLSVAKGLETVRHEGPSTIGIDTIYKSHGKIPEAFLRGCGVPDEFIAYIGSMVGRPIEFYSCFISYSTRDQEFAARLHADL